MIQVWTNQKTDDPEAARLIQPGLDKLSMYIERTDVVPAYIVAMGKISDSLTLEYAHLFIAASHHFSILQWNFDFIWSITLKKSNGQRIYFFAK